MDDDDDMPGLISDEGTDSEVDAGEHFQAPVPAAPTAAAEDDDDRPALTDASSDGDDDMPGLTTDEDDEMPVPTTEVTGQGVPYPAACCACCTALRSCLHLGPLQ